MNPQHFSQAEHDALLIGAQNDALRRAVETRSGRLQHVVSAALGAMIETTTAVERGIAKEALAAFQATLNTERNRLGATVGAARRQTR
jgi:hypothetical protein